MASGARYSTPAGLGSVLSQSDWPGCFANFPPRADRGGGVGGGWGLGSRELGRAARFPPAAQGFAKQRARASPWAWGGSRGWGERLTREGGRGSQGWGSGVEARVARRCTVLVEEDARTLGRLPPVRRRSLGSVLGSSPLGEPEVGLGLEPGHKSATRAA